jgi:hypothetical protein
MTIKFANRVKVSTSTTGTGTLTLGSAVNGFQTFAQGGILNGESIRYTIINGNEWEVGTGVYTHSGTTMSRSYEESSTGSLLNLAGDSEVFITVASTDIENIEDTANAALPKAGGTMTGAITFAAGQAFDGRDVSADGSKLDAIEASATADQTGAEIKALYEAETNAYTDTKDTKLSGIETGATADQTAAEIRSLVESATDSNVFTDADHTKLNAIEANADVTDTTNVTAAGALMDSEVTNLAQVKAFDSSDYATAAQGTTADAALPKAGGALTGAVTTNSTFDGRDVSADGDKLDGIEANATADQTGAEIKALYEAEANAYTDAKDSKLSGIETGATADQTASEIRSLVESATDSNVFTDADHTKLNGIEASADITDTTNVTAAGALMDSEVTNLAQVKAFDSSDYATAAQGSTADAALPKAGGTMTGSITFDASQTFDAADLTGTLPAIDGSNLTNVAASTIEVVESSDTNAFYPLLFASNNGSGNVQKSVVQDKDGSFINLSFNPSTNTFVTNDATLYGDLKFHGSTTDSNLTTLTVTDPTANRTITLPNATGTVALTSDIVTYSNATTSADGLMSSTDKTKLDGIEASADVTDVTNVTAAGALMDSEVTNLAQVKAFDSSDYATAAQGITADAALPKAGGALTGAVTTNSTFDGRNVATDGTKLDGIEAGATGDQTAAEIRALVESATDSNVFTDADHTKLNGIEASADVTDTANVTAAGALMDSECTSLASVKALNQGVATTDSPTFAALTIDGHTLQDSTNRSGLLQVDTDLGTWNGFSIASTGTSHWSIMGDQDDFGLYDDVNNEWIMLYNENSTLQLYSNGSNNLTVTSTGILLPTSKYIQFEGSTDDGFETNLTVADPTADRTITLPDATGTVALDDVATTSANGLMSSSDKTKLDGIESGATADQTAAEILTAIKTVDGSGSGLDADTVDGIEASSFLRSDADDSTSNTITFSNDIVVGDQIIHDGDSDTYMQFHNANEWRVVTGGTERLEVTNSAITSAEPILAPYFEATSDINLKENIVKVESAVSKIQKLNGYTYNFKDEPEISKAGLIAQEVQEVLPEAVRVDKDSNLRLDYNGTIALLVEAIKDQQKQIDQLTERLN